MSTPELIALVIQGGAVVVLFLWVQDLKAQRKEERDERLANAKVMETVGSSLGELTEAIYSALIEPDQPPPRSSRSRR